MCRECQTFQRLVKQYNDVAGVSTVTQEEINIPSVEEMVAIEYKQEEIEDEELGIIDDVVDDGEEEQGYEMLFNMEDIERSLKEVQNEIHESHARLTNEQDDEEENDAFQSEEIEKHVRFVDKTDVDVNADVFLTEPKDVVAQLVAVNEPATTSNSGMLSTTLTNCYELPPKTTAVKPLLSHMQIYQFSEGSDENSIGSGGGGDDGNNKENGSISTFPVTVIGDEGQGQRGEGQGFLEMLCNELPEETVPQ